MESSSVQTLAQENYLLHRVKFSVILSLQIPAFAFNLLIFVFFIKNRRTLQSPQNPALLILLMVNIIQLSVTLPLDVRFYFLGYVSPATAGFCTFWTFLEFTLNEVSEYLVATISVQRHMLIFSGHILRIRWKRIVFHHLPLLFCLIYPAVFYLFAILLYPCDGTQYDYSNNICGLATCYLVFDKVLGTLDWSVNNGLPMVIDVSANILLIARVIRQKVRRNQPLSWRKQRRMTVQLFCLSTLYIDHFLDLIYLVNLFLPWLCLALIPELLPWIKVVCHCRQPRNRVAASTLTHQPNGHHTVIIKSQPHHTSHI